MKCLLAAAACIGVNETFRSHVYTIGGKIYQQKEGASIGLRLTSVVALIRVARWMRVVKNLLKKTGIMVYLSLFCVYYVRLVVDRIPKGWSWHKFAKKTNWWLGVHIWN